MAGLALAIIGFIPAAGRAETLNHQLTADLRAIPGVSIRYYEVSGDSAAAVRAMINQRRPKDAQGASYDSITNAKITWNWSYAVVGGVCTVTDASVELRAVVTLPWLNGAAALSSNDRARWNTYIAALVTHEKGHVQYAQNRLEGMRSAILNSDCDGADAAAEAVMRRIARHDLAYDQSTDHGRTQGVSFR